MCSTGNANASVDGTVGGILLTKPIVSDDEFFAMNASNPNCSLSSSGGGLRQPDDPGQPDGPRDGGGGSDQPPGMGTGEIIVVDSPEGDNEVTLRMEGDYNAQVPAYTWDMGDGESQTGKEITHTYFSDGTYEVTCTVADQISGVTLDTESVEVTASSDGQGVGGPGTPPGAGTGELVVVEQPGTDGKGTFKMEGDYNAVFTQYEWDMGDGTTLFGEEVTHTYRSDGTYDITCTVTDNGTGDRIDQASTQIVVSVSGSPGSENPADGTIEGPTVVTVDSDNTWEYVNEDIDDPSNYDISWQMNNDSSDPARYNGMEVSHAYEFQGPKTIQVDVNERGVFGSFSAQLEYEVDVQDPTTGGLSGVNIPSMDEAAELKDREF